MASDTKKDTKKPESIDKLKAEFSEITNKIRQLLAGRKDKNDISSEDRNKLRQEYSKAAQKAKQISSRTTDTEEAKKYKEFFEKLSNEAANYGSVMNAQIPETTFDDVHEEGIMIVDSFDYESDFAARSYVQLTTWTKEKDPNYKHKFVAFGLAPGIKKFSFATEDEIKKFFTYIKEEEYEKYLFYFVRDGKYVPNFIKKEKRYAKYLT